VFQILNCGQNWYKFAIVTKFGVGRETHITLTFTFVAGHVQKRLSLVDCR